MSAARLTALDLARTARRHAAGIAVSVLAAGALAYGASYLFTPRYRVETTLAPHLENNAQRNLGGSLGGELGGLATLFGFDMTGGSAKYEALELLRAHNTTAELITERHLLPVLFASRWDAARQRWKDGERQPTMAEAVKRFDRNVRTVTEDRRTGLVTVGMTWTDPALAADWARTLVRIVNDEMRHSVIDESDRTLLYLQREVAKTEVVEMRVALFRLMESHQRNKIAATVREDYAFKVVDPPMIPDPRDPVFPMRGIFAALGVLAALVGAGLYVLARAGRERAGGN